MRTTRLLVAFIKYAEIIDMCSEIICNFKQSVM